MHRHRLLAVFALSLLLAGATPARDLDPLVAYARLLSLVRFFHPSDAVAKANWNQVAVVGVNAVEGAEDPASLARALETFFKPLAPTLRVVPNGARWEMPPELRERPAGTAGYHLSTERGDVCRRGGCARIVSDPIAVPRFVRPSEVLQADLGAGVTAYLPVSLYADTQTPPAVLPALPAITVSGDTREARLASVALAWGILQHFHPEGQPDDPRPAFAAARGDREGFVRAVRRMLVPLNDSRAGFTRKDEPLAALPLAWEWIEGQLTITGGAYTGDVVLSVGGRPAEEAVREEEALVSAATPEARRWWTLERLLYGPPGSRVTLQLKQAGEVGLARDTPYERLPAGTPLPPVAEPRPGIVYVDLGRIEETDFEALLPRLAAARGVVFDLRRGSNVSNEVLSHVTERTVSSSKWQVPVVMKPDHSDVEWLTTFWTIPPLEPRIRRAAFLIDGRSDGFSETLPGMIEEHRLGEVVGARSGGSNAAGRDEIVEKAIESL
ncbi:MAG: hypothetical protein ACJ759_12820 [Thermoanaerobaculia bacterium]